MCVCINKLFGSVEDPRGGSQALPKTISVILVHKTKGPKKFSSTCGSVGQDESQGSFPSTSMKSLSTSKTRVLQIHKEL